MNITLLKAVRDQIAAEPLQFNIDSWYSNVGVNRGKKVPNCGTTACIAGWVMCLVEGLSPAECYGKLTGIIDVTAEKLDIKNYQASHLFFLSQWPNKFKQQYKKATTPKQLANIAVKRINHFIRTKGQD